MSEKIGVTWSIPPHTQAKHEILRYYLGAWFPILATTRHRLLYIDGFTGPGEYKGQEDGSPIIALKVAKDHKLSDKLQRPDTELVFSSSSWTRPDFKTWSESLLNYNCQVISG